MYLKSFFVRFCLIIMLSAMACAGLLAQDVGGQKVYFAVEIQGKTIGYSEEFELEENYQGSKARVIQINKFSKMSLLGMPMDQREESKIYFDSKGRTPVYIVYRSDTGQTTAKIECAFRQDSAFCKTYLNSELTDEKKVELPPDVLIPSGNNFFVSLAAAMAEMKPGATRSIRLFFLAARDVSEATVAYEGRDNLTINSEALPAQRFLLTIKLQNLKIRFWTAGDPERLVRMEYPDLRIATYETDSLIATTLKRAEITDSILAQTNEQISEPASLTWMKIEVDIGAPGGEVSVDTLSTPDQKFNGAITGNTVKGIFEMAPVRYDGKNAPSFPPEISDDAALKKYIEPESGIESDHP